MDCPVGHSNTQTLAYGSAAGKDVEPLDQLPLRHPFSHVEAVLQGDLLTRGLLSTRS
jgi:hypothetical protein